jgi:hypothetical protein
METVTQSYSHDNGLSTDFMLGSITVIETGVSFREGPRARESECVNSIDAHREGAGSMSASRLPLADCGYRLVGGHSDLLRVSTDDKETLGFDNFPERG